MIAVVLGFYLFVGEFTPWLYRGGFLVLAIFTAVLIAAATHPASPLGPILGVGVLRYLGRRSYGIYLWHWPIFMVTRPGIDVPWSEPVAFVVRIGVTLLIAEISYRFIEMPVRRGAVGNAWRAVRSGTERSFRSLLTMTAVGVAAVMAIVVTIALVVTPGEGRDAIPPDVAEAMGIANDGPLVVSIDEDTDDDTSEETGALVPVVPESPSDSTPTLDGGGLAQPTIEEIRAANGSVSVIGDSVVLGARGAITDTIPGAKVDAEVSRMPGAFTGRVKKLDRREKLANVVVLHPATNGVLTEEILRNTLDPLVDYERVVVVNAYVPRSWERPNNRIIRNVVPDYPNVVIADWNARADGQRDYFVSDGIHLTRTGAAAFAELIKDSAGL